MERLSLWSQYRNASKNVVEAIGRYLGINLIYFKSFIDSYDQRMIYRFTYVSIEMLLGET